MRTDSQDSFCATAQNNRKTYTYAGCKALLGVKWFVKTRQQAERQMNKIVILARDIVTLIIFFRRLELLYSYS